MLHGVPKNEPRRAQDGPKRGQRRTKTTPRGTQEVQKSDPEPQDEKRTEPRRSQGHFEPPRVPISQDLRAQRGPFGRPNRHQNRHPNDQKSKRKLKMKKSDPRRSWTRLGAILGRSWPHLGVNFGPKPLENVMFREKSLFRR